MTRKEGTISTTFINVTPHVLKIIHKYRMSIYCLQVRNYGYIIRKASSQNWLIRSRQLDRFVEHRRHTISSLCAAPAITNTALAGMWSEIDFIMKSGPLEKVKQKQNHEI